MKTKFKVLLVSIFVSGMAIVYSTSCKKAVEKALYDCTTTGTGCSAIKVCANSSSAGYYEFDGVKYRFTAGTISAAAADAVAAMMAKCSSKSAEFSDVNPEQYFELLRANLLDESKMLMESVKLQDE